ncbi:11003_t:CDS:2 [Cetraspora pellucida]|uniref:11003_t:CDS:1 n=1 Tax=Cetraspora pellucida TaxID=1433469 RepID=A0ACA9KFF0_9GLOM|nr:11003_t:CDS:2 [Cetraspora pellucida]
MPKSKRENATKEYILAQGRDNEERFSKTIDAESSDSEYNNSELLIYESENNNKEELDNEIEPNEEEAKQLINEDNSFYNLKWNNNAASGQLLYYFSSSKCTQQCKNKELQKAAQGNFDITDNTSISEQLNKLNNILNNIKHMNAYEYLHYLAVHKYFTKIFDYKKPQSRIKFSFEISQQYISALIDNEDIQSSCLHFICTIGKRITAKNFQIYVNNNILLHITGSCTLILLETARTWLHSLGLVYQSHQQKVYYDGHEHPDIVQYHVVFFKKMKNFEQLMLQFVGENMEIVINYELSKGEKMHIFVTYDKCTFYASDGHFLIWAPLGMPPLCKKEIVQISNAMIKRNFIELLNLAFEMYISLYKLSGGLVKKEFLLKI